MAKDKDKNYVSLGFWIFALFIMAVPCINVVMMLIWAFVGENESRKNFFRAQLIWFGLVLVLGAAGLAIAGVLPAVIDYCATHWPRK